MNAVANSSTQLFERSAPTFTFDRNNRAIVALLRYIGAGYCCQVLGPRRHLKSRLIQEASPRRDGGTEEESLTAKHTKHTKKGEGEV